MSELLPALIFFVPIFTAVAMPLIGHWNRDLCRPIAILAIAAAAVLSIATVSHVWSAGAISYSFSGWAPPAGIEWLVDPVSSVMVTAVCLLALLGVIHGGGLDRRLLRGRVTPYHTILLLLVSGLIGVTFAADLFNVFVFLEVVAISAYALVALPGGRALVSAFRYLIVGTVGASCYLLGVGYLYAATGTLNFADMAQRLPTLLESRAVVCGLIFIFIGLAIKMALLPLHGWLPSAYRNAPNSTVPILAGLVTKVSLLVWVRILYWIVGRGEASADIPVFHLVSLLGIAAAVGGGILAVYQEDLKRIFACGGIAHIGLIVVGAGQMNHTALTGSLFYLINDAVMQFGLFALAGVAAHRYGIRTLADLGRARIRNPWILTALVSIAFGMVGFPPTGGFFGKWHIILGALEGGDYLAVAAVVLLTLLTIGYFARIFERAFHKGDGAGEPEAALPPMPWTVRVGLAAPAVAVFVLGLLSGSIIEPLRNSIGALGL